MHLNFTARIAIDGCPADESLQSRVDALQKQVDDLTRPRDLCHVATCTDNMDLLLGGGQAADTGVCCAACRCQVSSPLSSVASTF